MVMFDIIILLTKTTAAQNEDALSYYTVRGLYFLASCFCVKYNYQIYKSLSTLKVYFLGLFSLVANVLYRF